MAPQLTTPPTLASVVPTPTQPLLVGGNPMRDRPQLAGLVMQVISGWALVEYRMYGLTTGFLKAGEDFTVVAAMLVAARHMQRTVIRAAATDALSPEDFTLFDKVDSWVETMRKQRDLYAHGIWAITDDLPNDLVWIDPKYLGPVDAEADAWWHSWQQHPGLADLSSLPDIDRSKAFVYDEARVRRDVGIAERTGLLVVFLKRTLAMKPPRDPHTLSVLHALLDNM